MGEIQRYVLFKDENGGRMEPVSLGGWVDYDDHLAAVEAAREEERETAKDRFSTLLGWCSTYGKHLTPGRHADTFGDGMRAAKERVRRIVTGWVPHEVSQEIDCLRAEAASLREALERIVGLGTDHDDMTSFVMQDMAREALAGEDYVEWIKCRKCGWRKTSNNFKDDRVHVCNECREIDEALNGDTHE